MANIPPNQLGDDTSISGSVAPIQTGSLALWCTATAPTGWVFCDGSAYYINSNNFNRLYRVLGTVFNKQDTPQGKFCVPDLLERVPVGFGNTNPEWDISGNFGVIDGSGGIVIPINALPKHTHSVLNTINGTVNSSAVGVSLQSAVGTTQLGIFDILDASGNTINTQQPINVVNPYISIKYIIKL